MEHITNHNVFIIHKITATESEVKCNSFRCRYSRVNVRTSNPFVQTLKEQN